MGKDNRYLIYIPAFESAIENLSYNIFFIYDLNKNEESTLEILKGDSDKTVCEKNFEIFEEKFVIYSLLENEEGLYHELLLYNLTSGVTLKDQGKLNVIVPQFNSDKLNFIYNVKKLKILKTSDFVYESFYAVSHVESEEMTSKKVSIHTTLEEFYILQISNDLERETKQETKTNLNAQIINEGASSLHLRELFNYANFESCIVDNKYLVLIHKYDSRESGENRKLSVVCINIETGESVNKEILTGSNSLKLTLNTALSSSRYMQKTALLKYFDIYEDKEIIYYIEIQE